MQPQGGYERTGSQQPGQQQPRQQSQGGDERTGSQQPGERQQPRQHAPQHGGQDVQLRDVQLRSEKEKILMTPSAPGGMPPSSRPPSPYEPVEEALRLAAKVCHEQQETIETLMRCLCRHCGCRDRDEDDEGDRDRGRRRDRDRDERRDDR